MRIHRPAIGVSWTQLEEAIAASALLYPSCILSSAVDPSNHLLSMEPNEILIPGDFLRRVFEHVADTGRPLLRKRTPADGYVIRAWIGSPEFNLTLADGAMDDGVLGNIETWGAMADYLGMEVEELFEAGKKRGFGPPTYRLEEADDPGDATLWDPHGVAAAMKDHLGGPQLEDLLEGLPHAPSGGSG